MLRHACGHQLAKALAGANTGQYIEISDIPLIADEIEQLKTAQNTFRDLASQMSALKVLAECRPSLGSRVFPLRQHHYRARNP